MSKSLKILQFDFRFKGSKVSKEMDGPPKECIVGAHRETANPVTMSSNRLAEVQKVDTSDMPTSDGQANGEAVTESPTNVTEEREESPAA